MTKEKVNEIIMQYKDFIPSESVILLKNKLERADDSAADNLMSIQMKNPTTTLLFSLFLGGLGVDRFYIGDIGLGVGKLLLGGLTLGIWPLIDIFTTYKKAKKNNLNNLLAVL